MNQQMTATVNAICYDITSMDSSRQQASESAANDAKSIASDIAASLSNTPERLSNDWLAKQASSDNLDDVNIINDSGVVVASSQESLVGVDLSEDARYHDFLGIADKPGATYAGQPAYSTSADCTIEYAAASLNDGSGIVQIGLKVPQMDGSDIGNELAEAMNVYMPSSGTGAFVLNADGSLVASNTNAVSISSAADMEWFKAAASNTETSFTMSVGGHSVAAKSKMTDDMLVVSYVPQGQYTRYMQPAIVTVLFCVALWLVFTIICAVLFVERSRVTPSR
jgi:hypothetical protein